MIKLHHVSHRFGKEEIIHHINWELHPNRKYILTGPSGHGKTTLLKILAKLIHPTSGKVTYDGNIKLGYLFQNNALFDSLTAFENLSFPLRELHEIPREEIHDRVMHFLKLVGLEKAAKKFPNKLSGGMKKRLGIARALIINPSFMVYDEPTAGLDPITSREIASLISERFEASSKGMLIVSSDLHRIKEWDGEIYFLAARDFSPVGTFQEMKRHPNPMIHQFVTGSGHGPLGIGP
ncbi:MAG TPA: ATP-binding cassette domain-containing protein [Bdellovibrionota bacterium]|nr:ATP-binding cassette domain-containing protein [Bdellovibrionota bacterium]